MSKLIIMVASFAPQAGKTTFSDLFCRVDPCDPVASHQFAAPIKGMLSTLLRHHYGYTSAESVEAMYGSTKEDLLRDAPVTHRKMLQTLGTEWRLALGYETMWSDIVKSKIIRNDYNVSRFVIDDWRYIAEYDVIKQLEAQGFKVITVCIRNTTAEANYTGSHSSEGELKDFAFDHVVTNDGSMSDFIAKVHQFAASLGAE